MVKHSLQPISPLGENRARIDSVAEITISEMVDTALASLAMRRGNDKAFAAGVKKILKTELPKPGSSITTGDYTVIWTSPGQWFVEAPISTHEDVAATLEAAFAGSASVTEQSGGWVRYDVEGDTVVSMMQRLCAVDTATMAGDAATRSVIEHIGVFILCRTTSRHFSIYGPRSSAGSLHHALITAAKSIA